MMKRSPRRRRPRSFEDLQPRLLLTAYTLANNPVLEALEASLQIDESGSGSLEIDLESRKVATSNQFFVDELSNGDGSAANPFADLTDAFAAIDSQGLSSATINVAPGDYNWGDSIMPGGSLPNFSANLNIIGAGRNLTKVRQRTTDTYGAVFDEPGRSLYIEGVAFIGRGDPSSNVYEDTFRARNGQDLTLVDTLFRKSSDGDGLSVFNFNTVAIIDSVAAANGSDGFSYTNIDDGNSPMYVLESNVRATDNGADGKTSSQGSTIHRATEIVRVNSLYRNNPTNIEDTGLTSWNVGLTVDSPTVTQTGGAVNIRTRGDKQEVTDGLAWLISGSYGQGGIVNARATTAVDPAQTPIFGTINYSSLFDLSLHPPSVLTVDPGATLAGPDDSQLVEFDPGDPPDPPPPDPPPLDVSLRYELANNPVLQAVGAQVWIDNGVSEIAIDLEARKVPTTSTFYVDRTAVAGDGSQASPFTNLTDAFSAIATANLDAATIILAAGDYNWGDAIDPVNGEVPNFDASLNIIGAGRQLTKVRQRTSDTYAGFFEEIGKSLYIEGVAFIGRGELDSTVYKDTFRARNGQDLTLVDTLFRKSSDGDGLSVSNFDTVVVVDSVAASNGSDGFSYTKASNGGAPMYVLESNVRASNNGEDGLTSSQGSSIHRDSEIVRVNGLYRNNPTNIEDTGLTSWNVGLSVDNASVAQLGGPVNFRTRGDKQEVTDGVAWLISGSYGQGGIVNARATTAEDAAATPIFGTINYSSFLDLTEHPASVLTADPGATLTGPNNSQLTLVESPADPPSDPPPSDPPPSDPPPSDPPPSDPPPSDPPPSDPPPSDPPPSDPPPSDPPPSDPPPSDPPPSDPPPSDPPPSDPPPSDPPPSDPPPSDPPPSDPPPSDPPPSDPPPSDPPPSDPPSDPPPTASFAVNYRNRNTSLSATQIDAQIQIVNTSNEAVNLKDAEVRYYFTADGLTPQFQIRGTTAAVSASYNSSGDYAAVVVESDLILQPNEAWSFRLEIENAEQQAFLQSNDLSFDQQQTDLLPTDDIDLIFASEDPLS